MGKRLINKGADFSENGIHLPSWTKVLTTASGAVVFSQQNGQVNTPLGVFRSADASALATATHLKIIFKNWPNDVEHKTYVTVTNVGSYKTLSLASAPDTLVALSASVLSDIVTRLNNSETVNLIVQSPSGQAFTSEEQAKVTNAGATVEVEFYKYEE